MSNLKSKLKAKRTSRRWWVYHGDCTKVLRKWYKQQRKLFDAVITDPPYNLASITKRFGKTNLSAKNKTSQRGRDRSDGYARLSRGFMNERWDSEIAFDPKTWQRVYNVMKPGAYLIAMGGSRTSHRMTCAIEDAGFIIRDTHMWLHGQGFPKSHNISKALDKKLGRKRKIIGKIIRGNVEKAKMSGVTYARDKANKNNKAIFGYGVENITNSASSIAKLYDGWGTNVKPAFEPIIIAQKPVEGTIAANVIKYGTGGINIDACRINYISNYNKKHQEDIARGQANASNGRMFGGKNKSLASSKTLKGRWPANVLHDGSPEIMAAFGLFGKKKAGAAVNYNRQGHSGNKIYGKRNADPKPWVGYQDDGSVARFFYTAKTPKAERVFYCTHCSKTFFRDRIIKHQHERILKNGKPDFSCIVSHPTVKPLALMKYLTLMFIPPNGRVLDPFAGSGTTLEAANYFGFRAVGIEQSAEYVKQIKRRMRRNQII